MESSSFSITANLVDVLAGNIAPKTLQVTDGIIQGILPASEKDCDGFLIPGFVDSHVHIESSMLLPSEFARVAIGHGTVSTVSDPHEIANVCGVNGIKLMLRNAENTPLKIYFGAPSCVPATPFETAGAELDVADVAKLLDDPRIAYLSEMMNFPGVLRSDPAVLAKIEAAITHNKPIDGHAPGLRGEIAERYFAAGISTDHECTTLDEALDKIAVGCLIAIREGSAARNFDALLPLIDKFPDQVMLCSDDKHPDELLLGHINQLVVRAIDNGCDLMNVLKASSINAIRHYGLNVGQLQVGNPADFVLVSNLQEFEVLETYIDGKRVFDRGTTNLPPSEPEIINQFYTQAIEPEDLVVVAPAQETRIRVIEVLDGELLTNAAVDDANLVDGKLAADTNRDLLKIVVVNRYRQAKPSIGIVHGFGFQSAAIASSVAHDSHNVIAVGSSDELLSEAINLVIKEQGGLSFVEQPASGSDRANIETATLPLPVAGLMSTESCEVVGTQYRELDKRAKQAGCSLRAPYMTLSFLALPVIPALKLTDHGLFDVDCFEFTNLWAV